MLLSIIIPVYNAKKYLEKCLESILCQNFRDYEIILVDDGSKDESEKICDKYAAEYTNIIVRHIKNGGPSNARNVGLEIATGTYIQFVDSDDDLKNNTMEQLKEITLEYNFPEMIIYEAEVLDGSNNILGYERLPNSGLVEVDKNLLKLNSKTKSCMLHYIWNRWYRRDIIVNEKLRFNTRIHLGEDFLFNCTYLKYCNKFVFYKEPLYNYYKRENGSLTGKFRINELERRRIMFKAFCELYQSHGILEESLEQLEIMEANIAVVSMRSVGFRACILNMEEKKKFLNQFMNSEYEGYIQKALNANALNGFNKICAKILLHRKYSFFLTIIRMHK